MSDVDASATTLHGAEPTAAYARERSTESGPRQRLVQLFARTDPRRQRADDIWVAFARDIRDIRST
jgi:hypothetical protein